MYDTKIPVATYLKSAGQWNPQAFDADAWAAAAESAGMKYLIVTAKHHDGFAIYPTNVSPNNLQNSAIFTRDPLKELSQACKRRGIRFGVYYSQAQDWTNPGGGLVGHGEWSKPGGGGMRPSRGTLTLICVMCRCRRCGS